MAGRRSYPGWDGTDADLFISKGGPLTENPSLPPCRRFCSRGHPLRRSGSCGPAPSSPETASTRPQSCFPTTTDITQKAQTKFRARGEALRREPCLMGSVVSCDVTGRALHWHCIEASDQG